MHSPSTSSSVNRLNGRLEHASLYDHICIHSPSTSSSVNRLNVRLEHAYSSHSCHLLLDLISVYLTSSTQTSSSLSDCKSARVGGRSVGSGHRARIVTSVTRCDIFYPQADNIIFIPAILHFLGKESVTITIRNRTSPKFPLNCRIRWTLILISNRGWLS